MTFHIGQRVVCVDDEAGDGSGAMDWIKAGAVYTVSGLYVASDGIKCVTVGEVKRRIVSKFCHPGFRSSRFRPAVSPAAKLFRDIAQGVTDRKPIIDDPVFDPELPIGALVEFIHSFGGRPML